MAKIGIIGDGQLGQLTALHAQKMGHDTIIYGAGGKNSPAGQVSKIIDSDGYKSESSSVDAFIGEKPDVITIEWKNVPVELLKRFEESGLNVRPSSNILHLIQNRLTEKKSVNDSKASITDYAEIKGLDDLKSAYKQMGKGILKTTRDGYDGKGQIKIYSIEEMESAIEQMEGKELIYEKIVDFKMEISVIVGRNSKGEKVAFELVENIHKNGILIETYSPARNLDKSLVHNAKNIAITIADSIGIKGLLAVEMFVLEDGSILVNELAPRPHNSGHSTIEGYNMNQYQILIKAILDEPLLHKGQSLSLKNKTKMTNLLGDNINQIDKRVPGKIKIISDGNRTFYDYGKSEILEGRKMGHKVEIL